MFAEEPEFTMTDHLESYLAKWTEKGSWPFVEAKLESRLSIPGGSIKRPQDTTQFEIFAYEVEEILYTVSIRTASGYRKRSQVGESVMIQYNPRNPAVAYYAPACVLANRFMVVLVMLGGIAAIALAVSGILEKH